MATAVFCQSCQTVVFANDEWPQDIDMWAIAKYLKWDCPNCGQKENFVGFRILGGTLEDLRERAKEMNLKWNPRPEFGKIGGRDYIQAIGNLITEKGG